MADSTATPDRSLDSLRIDRSGSQRVNPPVPRKRRRKWFIAIGIVVLIVAFGVIGAARRPASVEVATVALAWPSQAITLLNSTGRVVAQRRAAVSSKATGRLVELTVREGQAVRAGEVIARIESADVGATREQAAASVRQAEANLQQGDAELLNAQTEQRRAQDLQRQNYVSQSAVDTADSRLAKANASIASLKAAIGVAQANLKAANVGVDQTAIRAPFDAVVLTKNANVGDIITPFSAASGTTGAVVNIADMSTLEVEADVSENSIARIAVDAPAEIQLDAFPDLRLVGKVSRIVPTVDRSKATLLVKVAFVEKDARVLPDMSAKVAFLERSLTDDERRAVVAVRDGAVVSRDGRDQVFVVTSEEGRDVVHAKPVTVGAKIGELVRVTGIEAGDRVVARPGAKLVDGARVAIEKK
ncbi:efflux RND transporter periplasmic adaptor subunit [soil metagenome]